MKKFFSLFVLMLLICSVFAQQQSTRVDKNAYSKLKPDFFVVNKGIQNISTTLLPGFTNGFFL